MLPLPALMSLLLPDTQLELLLKIPWASKIWNLQWTSPVSRENEFKASFPFWITDSCSIFAVQLQGCSCALGGGLRFLFGAGAGAETVPAPQQVSVTVSWGLSDTTETLVERKGQVTKTAKKSKRRKIFSDLWKYLSKFVSWTSLLLSYFSLCCCLGSIFYFCFCSLSYLDCLWFKIPACLQCEGCLFFKHLHDHRAVGWYFSAFFLVWVFHQTLTIVFALLKYSGLKMVHKVKVAF